MLNSFFNHDEPFEYKRYPECCDQGNNHNLMQIQQQKTAFGYTLRTVNIWWEKDPKRIQRDLEDFDQGRFEGICLKPGVPLEVLERIIELFPNLSSLMIESTYLDDLEILSALNLEHLVLEIEDNSFDLAWTPHLQYLSIGSGSVKQLAESNVTHLKIWRNERLVKSLPAHLEKLYLYQMDICHVDHLQSKSNLYHLEFGGMHYLKDIIALENLAALKHLNFEYCKRLKDFKPIMQLPQLESLNINFCKSIETIGFIKNLTQLECFSFYGTRLLSGDTSPMLSKQWKSFNFDNRRGYNVRPDEVARHMKSL